MLWIDLVFGFVVAETRPLFIYKSLIVGVTNSSDELIRFSGKPADGYGIMCTPHAGAGALSTVEGPADWPRATSERAYDEKEDYFK